MIYSVRKFLREKRANSGRKRFALQFSDRTRYFIDFVLDHYITEEVEELVPDRPPQLLELDDAGLNGALAQIGTDASSVRHVFFDFQKFLYEKTAA